MIQRKQLHILFIKVDGFSSGARVRVIEGVQVVEFCEAL